MNVETKLVEELENQVNNLHNVEVGTEEYKAAADVVAKLANQYIELKKVSADYDEKSRELEELKKDRKIRNVVEVIKVVVPVASAFTMGMISMRWEKLDSLTSTAGKSSLRDVLKFKW